MFRAYPNVISINCKGPIAKLYILRSQVDMNVGGDTIQPGSEGPGSKWREISEVAGTHVDLGASSGDSVER